MLFSPENRISISSMLFSPENRISISISSMLFSPENCISISSMLFSPENRISISSMLFSPENRISISFMLFSPENRISISFMLFSPENRISSPVFRPILPETSLGMLFLFTFRINRLLHTVYCLSSYAVFGNHHNASLFVFSSALGCISWLSISCFSFFQPICDLEYSYEESAILLEQLYRNWHNVIAHLRLADWVKAFKYHMKEKKKSIFRVVTKHICVQFHKRFIVVLALKCRRDDL